MTRVSVLVRTHELALTGCGVHGFLKLAHDDSLH